MSSKATVPSLFKIGGFFYLFNNLDPCSKAASWDEASPQWQPGRAGEYAATVVEIHLRDDQLWCWRGAVRGDL